MSPVDQINPLRYRRQFVLAEDELSGLPGWQKIQFGGKYYIHTHPDLDHCHFVDDQGVFEMVLLGYMLDPDHIEDSNQQIVDRMGASTGGDFDQLVQETYRKGGRWLLFYRKEDIFRVFADPAGLRSLFYIADPGSGFMAASQPNLITDYQPFEISESARAGFLETSAYTEQIEYMLPSGFSLYDEIRHLVPNHYLDLSSRQQVRFFPVVEKPQFSLEEGVSIITDVFQNLMLAAAKRFPLALAVTAGYDSRLMMSATRGIEDVKYYTLQYYNLHEASTDIVVPHKVLEQVGRVHQVFDCTQPMPPAFAEIYHANVHYAHAAWGNIAYGLSQHFPADHIAVKGNCGEIGRRYYYKFDYPSYDGVELLTRLLHYEDTPFGQQVLADWYQEINPLVEKNGYELLDFLYWEFRQGSWQAMSQLEWDLVQEVFVPFNCRAVLHTMLGMDAVYRDAITSKVQRAVAQNLWPEMLNIPTNPPTLIERTRNLKKRILTHSLYRSLRDGVKRMLKIESFHKSYHQDKH
ncbi:MAG: hypothetical protein V2J07_11080 [Anaerolineae bacterium]|jgi:hypothetical protein|nr:hypothetical protein [Anaerolineae bacterium]